MKKYNKKINFKKFFLIKKFNWCRIISIFFFISGLFLPYFQPLPQRYGNIEVFRMLFA